MSTLPQSPSSPLATPAQDQHRRRSTIEPANWHVAGEGSSHTTSPTGSTSTISDLASSANSTTHRFTDSARIAALRSVSAMSTTPQGTPPRRRPVIRADPTMITCFDPADKELYDLWVPRQ